MNSKNWLPKDRDTFGDKKAVHGILRAKIAPSSQPLPALYCLLTTACCMLAVGYWLLAAACLPLSACWWSLERHKIEFSQLRTMDRRERVWMHGKAHRVTNEYRIIKEGHRGKDKCQRWKFESPAKERAGEKCQMMEDKQWRTNNKFQAPLWVRGSSSFLVFFWGFRKFLNVFGPVWTCLDT